MYIVRLIAFIVVSVIVYKYFYQDIRIRDLYDEIGKVNTAQAFIYFLLAILLMPLNWFFESSKWRTLLKEVYLISHGSAFLSIIQGTSLGIITPGRIGEYGGRVIRLPKEYQAQGALATFICSLGQNMVNIICGLVAFLFLQDRFLSGNHDYSILIIGVVFTLLVLVISFFFLKQLFQWLSSFSFFNKRTFVQNLNDFLVPWNLKSQFVLLFFSALRYAVYLVQYIFVLMAFSVDISMSDMVFGIMMIFTIQTITPLTPLLQFAVRGGIAIAILGVLTNMHEQLLIASYSMWFMNLLIPALVGAVSLFWWKIEKRL